MLRWGACPIIVLLNNSSYVIEEMIHHGESGYNNLQAGAGAQSKGLQGGAGLGGAGAACGVEGRRPTTARAATMTCGREGGWAGGCDTAAKPPQLWPPAAPAPARMPAMGPINPPPHPPRSRPPPNANPHPTLPYPTPPPSGLGLHRLRQGAAQRPGQAVDCPRQV
jgi:hypothetical protein